MLNRPYDDGLSELDNCSTDGHKRVVFLIDVGNAVFLAIAVFTADYDGKNGRRFGKPGFKSLAGFNLFFSCGHSDCCGCNRSVAVTMLYCFAYFFTVLAHCGKVSKKGVALLSFARTVVAACTDTPQGQRRKA